MPHLAFLLGVAVLAPLLAAVLSGLFGRFLQPTGTNWVALPLLALSFAASACVFYHFSVDNLVPQSFLLYDFGTIETLHFTVGLWVDRLSAVMMVVVTFVSFLVHLYSVGYMKGDEGYSRFFSYISGFTFAMLVLVLSSNFLVLFFGWEGVGLFSYLLIGFWYHRDAANEASLKAFLANRVGDLGFLLGIALVACYFGTLDYQSVFTMMPRLGPLNLFLWGHAIPVVTVLLILLFIGAMGKSAQIPLHIWLEGSMEGPTPISALIHAATMVTAGVFMVARLSPLFEYSDVALSVVLMVGALTCFFMGLLGLVQNDIKRVIAYSTLSQLGYMIAAEGASAYSIGVFHLMTHAAFKALLFLAAGSVIVALHHEQDLRKMGGLARKMPITYVCMLLGALALAGLPPFAGFFSKDLIIDAVAQARVPGHALALFLVVASTLVTALYTFRMFFLVFHGKTRMTPEAYAHVQESPLTILLPLVLLAIPTVLLGMFFFHDALHGFFGPSLFTLPTHPAMGYLLAENGNMAEFIRRSIQGWPCILAISGLVLSYFAYVKFPRVPAFLQKRLAWIYALFVHKYFIDALYDQIFVGGSRVLGLVFYRVGDVFLIDRVGVQGATQLFAGVGLIVKKLQSGRLYHYTFVMVFSLFALLVIIALSLNVN